MSIQETAPARILIVDDSKVNRLLLARELEKQGYPFNLAENGKIALDMLAADDYDLILQDVEMPELDGYQTLQRVKENETLRHLPVIMVTAIDNLESTIRCIEMGAEDYLPKPFDPILLRARVGASLEKTSPRSGTSLSQSARTRNGDRARHPVKFPAASVAADRRLGDGSIPESRPRSSRRFLRYF